MDNQIAPSGRTDKKTISWSFRRCSNNTKQANAILGWPLKRGESLGQGLAYIAALRIEASDGSLSWVTLREVASLCGLPEYCWAWNPGESSSLPWGSLLCHFLLFPILKDNLQTDVAKLTGKKCPPATKNSTEEQEMGGGIKAIPRGSTFGVGRQKFSVLFWAHHEYALVRWDSQTLIGERFNASGRNSIGLSLSTSYLQFPHSAPKVGSIHRRIQSSLDMAENSFLGLLRRYFFPPEIYLYFCIQTRKKKKTMGGN